MERAEVLRNELLGKAVVASMEKRGFAAFYCPDKKTALAKAMELIPYGDVVSWGGSISINEIGLKDVVSKERRVIDREKAADMEERMELLRKSLTCDTFLMSSNAISEDGQLVNIDGLGNRCAALIFGPKQVIIVAGINKIAADVDAAVTRARHTAAPLNAKRFEKLSTPCFQTGRCMNCLSEECICNHIVITRHCRPAGRLKVIIVGENLGF